MTLFKLSTSSTNPPSTLYGSIINSNHYQIINSTLPEILKVNPLGKIFCFLENSTHELAKNLLETAFQKYNFLEMVILIDHDHTKTSLCTYDAFIRKDVFCKQLNIRNLKKSMESLKFFMKNRSKNLNGYKLKVNQPKMCYNL